MILKTPAESPACVTVGLPSKIFYIHIEVVGDARAYIRSVQPDAKEMPGLVLSVPSQPIITLIDFVRGLRCPNVESECDQ